MKSKFLISLAALPLVGFCGYVRVYSYNADHSISNAVFMGGVDSSNLVYPFYNNIFGLVVRGNGGGPSAYVLAVPLFDSSTVTNRSGDISHPITFSVSNPGNSTVWETPSSVSEIRSLFDFALGVISSGYSGGGLYDLGGNSLNHWYNFDYKVVVGNLLSSTNNNYRSLVLSHLSQISSHVVNIDTGVSQLRPVLDDIRDINTSTASNTADLVETSRGLGRSFDNVVTNTAIAASNSFTIADFMPNILSDLDNIHNDASLQSLDVYLGDNTQSWLDFLQWSVDNNYIDSTLAASLSQDLQSTDPLRKGRSFSIPDAHRRFFVKNQIKHNVVEAVKLRGRYQSFMTNYVNNEPMRNGIQNMGAAFNDSVTYQLGSNHAAAMDWREQLRQDLQAWKTSDEHGILNIKKSIDDNFSTRSPFSTNSVPFTTFVTNFVTRPLTNSIANASENISSNVQDSAQQTRDLLNDTLLNPEYDGVNVRIKFPIYGQHQQAVNVHDEAFDIYGSSIEELNQNVGDLLGGQSSYWQQLFNRWDRDMPEVTNLVGLIYNFLLTNSTDHSLNTLLLDDYSDYVSNGFYKAAMLNFADDYPSTYSNLVALGLNEDGSGNIWSLHGSALAFISSMIHSNNTMIASVLVDLAAIDHEFENHLGKSPLLAFKDILSAFPSPTDVEDTLNRVSDNTNDVLYAYADFESSLVSVSNTYDSVFKPFKGRFDLVPSSDIVLFKMANEKYVTIPVSDQPRAWEIIRVGFSFALVAVNIVLFPKYLLMVFLLFIKAFQRGMKFFPDDR